MESGNNLYLWQDVPRLGCARDSGVLLSARVRPDRAASSVLAGRRLGYETRPIALVSKSTLPRVRGPWRSGGTSFHVNAGNGLKLLSSITSLLTPAEYPPNLRLLLSGEAFLARASRPPPLRGQR